jgi:hypothetical protein
MNIPFCPSNEDSVTLAVGVASARVALRAASVAATGNAIRLYNGSTVDMYLRFGDVTVVATVATGFPLPVGTLEVLTAPAGTTHIAAITASGTGNLICTLGGGL